MELMQVWIRMFMQCDVDHISIVPTAEVEEWDFVDDSTKVFRCFDSATNLVRSAFLVHQNKLAIAFWSIAPLIQHVLPVFKAQRELQWRDDPVKLSTLSNYTFCLLCISADCYTAWNTRRELIIHSMLHSSAPYSNLLYSELKKVNIVLTKTPKSSETWAYRKWLLNHFHKEVVHNKEIILKEIEISQRFAEEYPRNYYAWTYRQIVVGYLEKEEDIKEQLQTLVFWMKKHVSDYCGYHYRHFLWKRFLYSCHPAWSHTFNQALIQFPQLIFICQHDFIVNEEMASKILQFWKGEWILSTNLITCYPGHESLWCHRKSLLVHWVIILLLSSSLREAVKQDKTVCDAIIDYDEVINTINLSYILSKESPFIHRHCTDDGICLFEKNKRFAIRYKERLLYLEKLLVENNMLFDIIGSFGNK